MSGFIRSVATLTDSITGLLTGTNLNDITNLNGVYERTAREMMQKVKVPEAMGRYAMTLYSGVYDYLVDSRIYGTSVLDMRPQGASRSPWDYAYKEGMEDFDRTKGLGTNGYEMTFEYRNGVPILRVVTDRTTQQVVLDPMNALTGWATGGNASGLAVDSTVYYQQPAALRFNLAAAGSQGYIEKTLTSQLDLTAYQGVGVIFLAVEMPTATDITSIGIHLGNDSSHYYDVSNTAAFLGSFQAGIYQLIALDLSLATPTGTVDITKIDYVRVYMNYDGVALTNVRVGGLFISLPSPAELLYTTAAFFADSTSGLLSQSIANVNDQIILTDPAYVIYEYMCAINVVAQAGGSLSSGIAASFNAKLNGARARNGAIIELGLIDLYRADNPSQELRSIGNWYTD